MAKAPLDRLLSAEAGLNRSVAACVAAYLAQMGWAFFLTRPGILKPDGAGWITLGLFLVQVACYAWYAGAAGAAANALREPAWIYVVWILVAPFAALVALVFSTLAGIVVGASPLSIKFLLGGQLQVAIRESTFAD